MIQRVRTMTDRPSSRRTVLFFVLLFCAGCSEDPVDDVPPWEVSGTALGLRDVDLRDFVPACASDDCVRLLERVSTVPIGEAHFLAPDDWVVAVQVAEAVRAYPMSLLWWHQGIHDTLGDQPVFVSHSALTGSTIVYKGEHAGEVRRLRFSSRLYNSCAVYFYELGDEQVWLPQLYTASVTGEDAPQDWERVAFAEMTWSTYEQRYPQGDVATLETGFDVNYSIDPFESYRKDQGWIVSPLSEPPDNRYPWKERTLLVRSNRAYRAYPASELVVGEPVFQELDGASFTIEISASGEFLVVPAQDGASVEAYPTFWFAAGAFHRGVEAYQR